MRERYKKGKLSAECVSELEDIENWTWGRGRSGSYIPRNFDQISQLLDSYLSKYGNLEFPVSYESNGIRLGGIIYDIKKRLLKNPDSLSVELIKKLESYPCWSWKHHKSVKFKLDIDLVILEIENFRKTFGHIAVPSDYESNGIKLGAYIQRCKYRYKKGKLENDTANLLDKIDGWSCSQPLNV